MWQIKASSSTQANVANAATTTTDDTFSTIDGPINTTLSNSDGTIPATDAAPTTTTTTTN